MLTGENSSENQSRPREITNRTVTFTNSLLNFFVPVFPAESTESIIYFCGSFICVTSNELITSNPIASNSAGVNEPLGVFNASIIYTNTTDA